MLAVVETRLPLRFESAPILYPFGYFEASSSS